jgi:thiamine-phosphate pyrophosphorylase
LDVSSTARSLGIHTRHGLYAIVDPDFCRGRDPIAVAEAILDGGCAVLQLRTKQWALPELEALALRMLALCRDARVPFVVNDHPDLAQRIGAEGVHLGQRDMPLERARALLAPTIAIGLSTHDLRQASAAEARGADLIGFGPVFATRTKHDPDPVVGLHALREVCRCVAIPVIAIGGITPDNVAEVAASGAAMAAAIGAVCGAEQPREAALFMHAAFAR